MNVLIIDDHKLFSDGLEQLISGLADDIQVSKANSVEPFIQDTGALESYDLVLLDLRLPKVDGYTLLNDLTSVKSTPPVIAMSGTESPTDVERALTLGVRGFLSKTTDYPEILHGIRAVLDGEKYISRYWEQRIDLENVQKQTLGPDTISDRQRQMLDLLAQGLQNKEIGRVLNISDSTVKFHLKSLFKLLNVNNRLACVKVARERGLCQ